MTDEDADRTTKGKIEMLASERRETGRKREREREREKERCHALGQLAVFVGFL